MKTSRVTLLPLIRSMIQLFTLYLIYLCTPEKREVRRNPWAFSAVSSYGPFWRLFRRDTSSTMIRSSASPSRFTYPMDVSRILLEAIIGFHRLFRYNSRRSIIDGCHLGDIERNQWFRCWIRAGWYVWSTGDGLSQCVSRFWNGKTNWICAPRGPPQFNTGSSIL